MSEFSRREFLIGGTLVVATSAAFTLPAAAESDIPVATNIRLLERHIYIPAQATPLTIIGHYSGEIIANTSSTPLYVEFGDGPLTEHSYTLMMITGEFLFGPQPRFYGRISIMWKEPDDCNSLDGGAIIFPADTKRDIIDKVVWDGLRLRAPAEPDKHKCSEPTS